MIIVKRRLIAYVLIVCVNSGRDISAKNVGIDKHKCDEEIAFTCCEFPSHGNVCIYRVEYEKSKISYEGT